MYNQQPLPPGIIHRFAQSRVPLFIQSAMRVRRSRTKYPLLSMPLGKLSEPIFFSHLQKLSSLCTILNCVFCADRNSDQRVESEKKIPLLLSRENRTCEQHFFTSLERFIGLHNFAPWFLCRLRYSCAGWVESQPPLYHSAELEEELSTSFLRLAEKYRDDFRRVIAEFTTYSVPVIQSCGVGQSRCFQQTMPMGDSAIVTR